MMTGTGRVAMDCLCIGFYFCFKSWRASYVGGGQCFLPQCAVPQCAPFPFCGAIGSCLAACLDAELRGTFDVTVGGEQLVFCCSELRKSGTYAISPFFFSPFFLFHYSLVLRAVGVALYALWLPWERWRSPVDKLSLTSSEPLVNCCHPGKDWRGEAVLSMVCM